MDKGKLYLIPSLIGSSDIDNYLPDSIINHIRRINIFIVENVRSARRFIKKVDKQKEIDACTFYAYGKHDNVNLEIDFLPHILKGEDVGIISEAGLPCVADPGSVIVEYAHDLQIKVVPLVGPSSIFLALMASGLNGQSFVFHGYLPINQKEREIRIRQMQNDSREWNQTQIFMETPYRNNQLFESILRCTNKDTRLCIATDITLSSEQIKTLSVEQWKHTEVNIHKKPTMFLLHAK